MRASSGSFSTTHRPAHGFIRARPVQACSALVLTLACVALSSPAEAGETGSGTPSTLTGNWGARTRLLTMGADVDLTYTGEVFGNLSGGLERGAAYEDLISLEVNADLGTVLGWTGARANVAIDQIDDGGRNADDLVGAISDPSNIDARPTTRLMTLWIEQDLGEAGNVRVGQLDAGEEFLISDIASNLINDTFGWPNIVAVNLPGGGPAYPLAAPGTRLKLAPTPSTTMLAAIISGDPAGACGDDEDPQVCNKHGTTFSFTGGALLLGEVQYRPHDPAMGQNARSAYKFGGFYHTADFADEARGNGNNGRIVSLAVDPSDPLEHQGNWGFYGVADHAIWWRGNSALSVFLRGAAVPADRNLVSWYVDGGFALTGPFRARPHDTLAFGIAYSNISNTAVSVDKVRWRLGRSSYPIRDGETVFELAYRAQLAPWWALQPDLQYIIHPGGRIPDPDDPGEIIGNSLLIGLRTTIAF